MIDFEADLVAIAQAEADILLEDILDIPAGIVPEDLGRLRRSVEAEITEIGLEGFTIVITYGTPAGVDFDYPAYLNVIDVIRPTQADVLSWVDGTGRRFFANEIVNTHQGWFDNDYLDWLSSRVDRFGS